MLLARAFVTRRAVLRTNGIHIYMSSVSGMIYEHPGTPTIQLFTKKGCTLCDKVKDILQDPDVPSHSLEQVDITDDNHQEYFDKYQYDIPVLHVEGVYWTKHRLTVAEAVAALEDVQRGKFVEQEGEPNAAAAMEATEERRRQNKSK